MLHLRRASRIWPGTPWTGTATCGCRPPTFASAKCEQGMTGKGRGEGTVSFPELRRGSVGVFIATLLPRLLRPNLMPAIQRYESMEAAYAAAHGQMAYYRALEQQGYLRWIKDAATLKRHVAAWQKRRRRAEPLGFILSMEGADPVLSPEQVRGMVDAGPPHHRSGALRRQSLCARHRHGGRPVPARPGAAQGDGARRHDPRRDASVRPVFRRSARHLRRPGAGEPSQLPRAGARSAAADRRADQAADCARRGHRRRPRHLDAGPGLGARQDDAAGNAA